jgi:hypothetical protein
LENLGQFYCSIHSNRAIPGLLDRNGNFRAPQPAGLAKSFLQGAGELVGRQASSMDGLIQ